MLVILSSVTSAQRLKKQLAARNIASEIIQTPKRLSEGGCSYSLRLNKNYLSEVSSLASSLHISVKKIYQEES
ncbi:MAG: DUF3343 domain-containing protein [Clostridia bacterium]|nr:DUF3343 domain-containing protein [Clostridia bacterium]